MSQIFLTKKSKILSIHDNQFIKEYSKIDKNTYFNMEIESLYFSIDKQNYFKNNINIQNSIWQFINNNKF